jgi:hypothetical protein
VELFAETTIRALDFLLGSIAVDAENGVEITRHGERIP